MKKNIIAETKKLINENYIYNINNFILIIDFPNLGGGTTNFLKYIISNYKANNTFIIIRNFTNKIILTINDEYELNETYDEQKAILFLNKYKNKIIKIFVNHTLGHSIIFLNKLFELNKEVTTITHDFYSITDIANQYISNILETYNNPNKISINKYNQIITQNKNNLFIYNNHIKNKDIPIIISELPDYKFYNKLIETTNTNIVIGIFGKISNIKGAEILQNIISFFLDKNIRIIIFGSININYEYKYIYNSIEDLNNLLIKYKPNILLELSLWPETYSYTLSLKMITKLPILYLKKTGNFVVEERLSHYDKAYPFTNINELNELINKYKQNWFYTIKPNIYFNSFWNEYFGTMYKINNQINNEINNEINSKNFYKKIAVISVNFGNYDNNPTDIKNIHNYDYFDWYYITDNKEIISNSWNIITYYDYHIKNINKFHNNDFNRMYSKFYKTQIINIEFFNKYEYFIWIDASFIINNINFIKDIISLLTNNPKEILYIFEHSERDNIKEEANTSITLQKYNKQNLNNQIEFYYSNGYKTNLYESGFMIYKNNFIINKLMNDWWNEIIKYSYQCQLSLPYILFKNNIKPYLLNEKQFVKGKNISYGSIWKNNLIGYMRNHI
jgi:hypothetical protein